MKTKAIEWFKAIAEHKWLIMFVFGLAGTTTNGDRIFSAITEKPKIVQQKEIEIVQLEARPHSHPEIIKLINANKAKITTHETPKGLFHQ